MGGIQGFSALRKKLTSNTNEENKKLTQNP